MRQTVWGCIAGLCVAIWGGPFLGHSALADEPADEELVQMVLGLLADPDKDLRALGLEQIRASAPGKETTLRFAAQLPQLPADAQASLITALAERGDVAAAPAVRQMLAEPKSESAVRSAAITALGRLGDISDLPALVPLLTSEVALEQAAAQTGLVQLRGDDVPAALADHLPNAPVPLQIALLDVLVARRAYGVADRVLPLSLTNDAKVRSAAMQALGQLAGGAQLVGMLAGVLRAPVGPEREAAEKAVMFACERMDDAAERSQQLLAASRPVPTLDQPAFFPTLGRVGGEPVLTVVNTALARPESRDLALRGLCNWPDASIAPRLLALFESEKQPQRRTMILQALVRVAPLPDGRADAERLELLRTVFGLCGRVEDKLLVVKRARAVRSIETLRFVLPLVEQPELAEAACETVVELAHHRSLREPNKPEFDTALDKVLGVSHDATTLERARRYKKGQTWARPKAA